MCEQYLFKKPQQGTKLKNLIVSILSVAFVSTSMSVFAEDNAAPATESTEMCEAIYGVHDDKLNDSLFVTIDPVTFAVTPLSEKHVLTHIHKGYELEEFHNNFDIEGLDISTDGELIGSSGDDGEAGDPNGTLYNVSTSDGSIEKIDGICFDVDGTQICNSEVSAISFRPTDNSLWGWAEECGLIEVNKADPANSTLVLAYPDDDGITCLTQNPQDYTSHVEDMTWDTTGDKIYFSDANSVYVYEPSNSDIDFIIKYDKNVEAVEALPDGTLLVGLHDADKLWVLEPNYKATWEAEGSAGEYTDIEAIACLTGDDTCTADWTYVADSINDSTGNAPEHSSVEIGNTYFEIYGMAVKIAEDTVTVAVNSRLPIGGVPFNGVQINWGDVVLDFDGVKYGVRFDATSDSGVDGTGLFAVTALKSVSIANRGHTNFVTYDSMVTNGDGNPLIGNLSNLNNGYFGNTDKMPTSIDEGTKLVDITLLDASALTGMGLDFATSLGIPASTYDSDNPFSKTNPKPANELGEYTFGFSFPRQAGMTSDFVAYLFTECGNDGIAMVNNISTMVENTSCD